MCGAQLNLYPAWRLPIDHVVIAMPEEDAGWPSGVGAGGATCNVIRVVSYEPLRHVSRLVQTKLRRLFPSTGKQGWAPGMDTAVPHSQTIKCAEANAATADPIGGRYSPQPPIAGTIRRDRQQIRRPAIGMARGALGLRAAGTPRYHDEAPDT